MITRFRTITGSIYRYDSETKIWDRMLSTSESGKLRSDAAVCEVEPLIEVGQRVSFLSKPLDPRMSFRLVLTSEVAEILNEATEAKAA